MSKNGNKRGIGDNLPPPGDATDAIRDRLDKDYDALRQTAEDQINEASKMPDACESDEDLNRFSDLIVRLRDTSGRVESNRVAEKEPYLRGGQAVDGWFNVVRDLITIASRPLIARVNVYQQQKKIAEEQRRRREREEAERIEREARERQLAAEREAEAARLAAAQAKRNRELKREAAIDAAAEADAAVIEARMATEQADQARVQAAAKAADMVRQRFDTGRLTTMKTVPYVAITDKSLLDWNALAPYISEQDALKALRMWARVTNHKQQMAGAVIEMRDASVIR